jgi:hypothetical protein
LLPDSNGSVISLHIKMITPVAEDFNGDGPVDLPVGDEDNLKLGALYTPFSVDWDNYGIYDLLVSAKDRHFNLLKNKTEFRNK